MKTEIEIESSPSDRQVSGTSGQGETATGLSESKIATLRLQYGFNEVKEKSTPAVVLFLKKFWGLTAWMLEVTIIISFLLHKNFDAWVITLLLLFNGIIGFLNERKAAQTVASLQQQLQIMVRVLRDGNWTQVPARELLPGDVVRIRTGDFLAADVQLTEGALKTDKSALTGESELTIQKPGDTLYAGSVVKGGEGTAVVTAIATQTFFGKTTKLVLTARHRNHMEEVVGKLVRFLFIAVVLILLLTTVAGVLSGQSLLGMVPLVLILLVSAVPVGLPAMFTISMAGASKELAEDGLLVTQLSATEDAATLTTLCIDKTGTITKNELTLQDTIASPSFSKSDVILYGSMASVEANEDAIDLAFISEAERQQVTPPFKQLSFVPFTAAAKHTEALVDVKGRKITVAKGAYPAIKELCALSTYELDSQVDAWALKGFKTIAVAIAEKERQFTFIGIAALYDPPRPDAGEMIARIKGLGIDLKMLTGDALPIGKEIAGQVGIGHNIVSFNDVRQQFDKGQGGSSIHAHNGFAEVLPEDKFTIVKTLQKEHRIVGMTGDGVNDAPALKQAEVGIAVKNATDVARQAASIILLKEGLQQILDLVRVGRSTHARISNYAVNKIAKTIQTIFFVCLSFLITRQFVVATIDMVILLFLIDFVVLALAVDKVSWSRLPATWDIKPLVVKGGLIGLLLFSACLIWFFFAKSFFGLAETNAQQSLGFTCLFFSSIFSILIIRTDKRFYQAPADKFIITVIVADILVVCLMLYFGFPGFTRLPPGLIASSLAYFLFINFVVNDSFKMLLVRKLNRKKI